MLDLLGRRHRAHLDAQLDKAHEQRNEAESRYTDLRKRLSDTATEHVPIPQVRDLDPERFFLFGEVHFDCVQCGSAWPCERYVELGNLSLGEGYDPKEHLAPLVYRHEVQLRPTIDYDPVVDFLITEATRHVPYFRQDDQRPGNFLYSDSRDDLLAPWCSECRRPWPCPEYARMAAASLGHTGEQVDLPKFTYDRRVFA